MIAAATMDRLVAAGAGRVTPEVIVPANVSIDIMLQLSRMGLVPVVVDVHPAYYVPSAPDVIGAMTTQTVGVYLPHTYGTSVQRYPSTTNAGEQGIEQACRVRRIRYCTDAEPTDTRMPFFRRLYDGLSFYADRVTMPAHFLDTPWLWTAFPLTLRAHDRTNVLGELQGVAVAAHGDVTQHARMGECGAWIQCAEGDGFVGAPIIQAKGIVVPLREGMSLSEVDSIVCRLQAVLS